MHLHAIHRSSQTPEHRAATLNFLLQTIIVGYAAIRWSTKEQHRRTPASLQHYIPRALWRRRQPCDGTRPGLGVNVWHSTATHSPVVPHHIQSARSSVRRQRSNYHCLYKHLIHQGDLWTLLETGQWTPHTSWPEASHRYSSAACWRPSYSSTDTTSNLL